MKKRTKLELAAGVAAVVALAIALGAAGAIASSSLLWPNDDSQAVIDDAAEQLGVEPSALTEALEQALKNHVDAAVGAGRLTEDQGERLKERIDSGELALGLGFGHRGFRFGFRHVHGLAGLEAAASYLELSRSELRERLVDGDTLAEIARAEGKSVDGLVQALVEAAEQRIDDAVANGRLDEKRAAALEENLEARMSALVDRELRGRGFGRGFGFLPRPPPFAGPRG